MTLIYTYTLDGIDGTPINLNDYREKHILIVNVASECGYTRQYEQLQELHEAMGDRLVILAVPSNEFGGQEPGTNDEIHQFACSRYNVSFLMSAKQTITGDHAHPLYKWLTNKSLNGVKSSEVKWNFQKYLIDPSGQLIDVYSSAVSPIDEVILEQINKS